MIGQIPIMKLAPALPVVSTRSYENERESVLFSIPVGRWGSPPHDEFGRSDTFPVSRRPTRLSGEEEAGERDLSVAAGEPL